MRGDAGDEAGEGLRKGGPDDAQQAAPTHRGPQHRGLHDGQEQRHDLVQGACGLRRISNAFVNLRKTRSIRRQFYMAL